MIYLSLISYSFRHSNLCLIIDGYLDILYNGRWIWYLFLNSNSSCSRCRCLLCNLPSRYRPLAIHPLPLYRVLIFYFHDMFENFYVSICNEPEPPRLPRPFILQYCAIFNFTKLYKVVLELFIWKVVRKSTDKYLAKLRIKLLLWWWCCSDGDRIRWYRRLIWCGKIGGSWGLNINREVLGEGLQVDESSVGLGVCWKMGRDSLVLLSLGINTAHLLKRLGWRYLSWRKRLINQLWGKLLDVDSSIRKSVRNCWRGDLLPSILSFKIASLRNSSCLLLWISWLIVILISVTHWAVILHIGSTRLLWNFFLSWWISLLPRWYILLSLLLMNVRGLMIHLKICLVISWYFFGHSPFTFNLEKFLKWSLTYFPSIICGVICSTSSSAWGSLNVIKPNPLEASVKIIEKTDLLLSLSRIMTGS